MMRAAWYERQGPARTVLQVGEMDTPQPRPGELRVRVAASGVHAGDLGKRAGAFGPMPFPRVVPHGDGAGVVDAVGAGVHQGRIGQRVWVYLAQSYRPYGTAAEFTVVPAEHAVPIPDGVSFRSVAALGIPGITAHRAIFADGPVNGARVLVTGALGAVGRAAVAVARRGGATVIASVRHSHQIKEALAAGAHHAVAAGGDFASRVLEETGNEPIDRVADMAFDTGIDVYADLLQTGGVIATYATADARPEIPYWPLAFKNISIRLISNDDFPQRANEEAAAELTAAIAAGDLELPVGGHFPLERIVGAHEAAEQSHEGSRFIIEL
ncbi:NADPH:quinone oxidoreductase [Planotetraspora thailandica]|uniref:NADPH:quinone oxidoreductase n=1 Tax=Planotetraspora thailandica TaxID=487172 RepID=A0A8J3VF91_9ACTN|nr:zinc-binding dehydrogenase [Planotetraspora thailandica]GII57330.1 NADPH:quinone oxidoreductase [Planotetraspora thailandica]